MKDGLIFHIGFHKTGTTWLQKKYFSNPDLFHLLNDPIVPWNDDLCRMIINPINHEFCATDCIRCLELRYKVNRINVLSAERLSGHPISGGYDSHIIAKRLFDIKANAKIVISRRNPFDFIKSTYKQVVKEGYCGSFFHYLSEAKNWKTRGTSREYFMQDAIINLYRKLFGSGNVLVLHFEDFQSDNTSYSRQINSFLGLPNREFKTQSSEIVINKTFSNRHIRSTLFFNKFRKSEYNKFPLISFHFKMLFYCSKYFRFMFSDSELVGKSVLDNYLNKDDLL